MTPSPRPVRLVAAFAALAISSAPVADACNEPASVGLSRGLDGFLVLDADGGGLGQDPAAGGCPVPPCSNQTCGTENPATPFQRLPGYEAAPIFDRAGCFGVAKRDASFYVQLSLDGASGAPGGFHRHVSTDGGFTWTEGPVVIAANSNWWTGIKCPDPHFLDTQGNMVVYFKASGNPGGIARAVSTDDGVTWVADPAPVLTAGTPGYYVDNPSVIRRNANLWMMAYTYGCAGGTGPFQMAETHLATSPDGITWTKSPLNPALVPGSCDAWDQGAIANPVLMNDPDHPNWVHLFYTGADWTGTTTRGCAKIGHAISTNLGRNWCKTGVVLDHPAASSVAWDDGQYMVSSYTLEANGKIRMYYWASGNAAGDPVGLGVAEADWPLAGCSGPVPEETTRQGLAVPGLSDDALPAALVQLRAQPNPTTGGTSIEHDLASAEFAGAGVLQVFDVAGREVATAWRGRLEEAPDRFQWDGRNERGQAVAAGRYLLRLEAGGSALATTWVTVTAAR
jgi:hypothetical protein